MVTNKIEVYVVRIIWFGCDRFIELAFTDPPVRKDIAPILEERWRSVDKELQNNGWEFRLIVDYIPEIPWEGMIENVYGRLDCRKRFLLVNGTGLMKHSTSQ